MSTIRSKADYLNAKLGQVKDLFNFYEGRTSTIFPELLRRGFTITQINSKRGAKTTKESFIISHKGHNLVQITA